MSKLVNASGLPVAPPNLPDLSGRRQTVAGMWRGGRGKSTKCGLHAQEGGGQEKRTPSVSASTVSRSRAASACHSASSPTTTTGQARP